MTTADLYKQHKSGKISKERFLYEVRRDQNLPFITNLTSYSDAIKILKNKSIIKENHDELGIMGVKLIPDSEQDRDSIENFLNSNSLDFEWDPEGYYFVKANSKKEVDSYFDVIKDKIAFGKTDLNATIQKLRGSKTVSESIEQKQDIISAIDRMNPTIVMAATKFELEKMPEITDENFVKAQAKAVKNLLKNPHAYDDLIIANAKTVEKKDVDLKMSDVKKENTVDKKNEMKKPKGTQVLKANVKSSKKENKKGNPKGVKQMTYDAKTAKGIKKVMEKTGKEKVLEAITKVLKEDSHFSYGIGQTVPTPEGEGVVKEIVGGTLTVELKNGNTKDYQINVIEYAKEQSKLPKVEETPVENKQKEKKDSSIISKLKEIVKKIKLKKEAFALKDKAGNLQYAKDSTEASDIQNKAKAKGVMLTKTSV